MIIAVFLDNIYLIEADKRVKHIILLKVDKEIITAVGEELIKINDINYLLLWLLAKKVEIVYFDEFSLIEKQMLQKADISVKSLNEIRNNPVLKAMLIKSKS